MYTTEAACVCINEVVGGNQLDLKHISDWAMCLIVQSIHLKGLKPQSSKFQYQANNKKKVFSLHSVL